MMSMYASCMRLCVAHMHMIASYMLAQLVWLTRRLLLLCWRGWCMSQDAGASGMHASRSCLERTQILWRVHVWQCSRHDPAPLSMGGSCLLLLPRAGSFCNLAGDCL